MILGKARVSTEDKHFDAQISALKVTGAERIFAKKNLAPKNLTLN